MRRFRCWSRIAGRDAYYEFEINPLGTIYEALFVWEDAYESGGFSKIPELARNAPTACDPFLDLNWRHRNASCR
jgi:hypothetical protein